MISDVKASPNPEQYIQEAAPMLAEVEKVFNDWSQESELSLSKSAGHIEAMLRVVHTFKAHARGAKIQTMQRFAHHVEEKLAAARGSVKALPASELAPLFHQLSALFTDAKNVVVRPDASGKRRGMLIKIPEARVLELRKRYRDALSTMRGGALPTGIDTQRFDDLGRAVAGLTAVPIADLVDRFRKMSLDLAGELGKRVDDLNLEDNGIEVDTKLADKIRDILLHALRNAIDHGIESPDDRKAMAKSEKGTIVIRCAEQDGKLNIVVQDDGRGVDLDAVKAKAYQKGILSAEQLDRVSEQELLNILFRPGFSTAKTLTDVSGRGVGMDFIATTIKDLGGTIEMKSQFGKGSQLCIQLPANLYQEL